METTSIAAALQTLQRIETDLKTELFEREEAIRASLVALLARSHLVLLGPPGTAKSELVKRIAERFCDPAGQGLAYFVYLLTRFTTPEELFGPVSVHGLKNDTYERITAHKLPEAQLVFLDEVFKSSSAVLNTLLTILNERLFDNGTRRVPVPLISLFGASNEMPQEAQDLEALWDRFLLRVQVGYLSEGNFEQLLQTQLPSSRGQAPAVTMSQVDLQLLQDHAAALPIPRSVTQALVSLRRDLAQQKGIVVSDRRWMQCLGLLQAHAVLEGRDTVEEDDLAILSLSLWNQPEQQAEISRLVSKLANPINAKATELKDNARTIWQEAKSKMQANAGEDEGAAVRRAQVALEALGKVKRILGQLEALKEQAIEQGRPAKRVEQAIGAASHIRQEILDSGDL